MISLTRLQIMCQLLFQIVHYRLCIMHDTYPFYESLMFIKYDQDLVGNVR